MFDLQSHTAFSSVSILSKEVLPDMEKKKNRNDEKLFEKKIGAFGAS
jgi:hypothetical protein